MDSVNVEPTQRKMDTIPLVTPAGELGLGHLVSIWGSCHERSQPERADYAPATVPTQATPPPAELRPRPMEQLALGPFLNIEVGR